MNALEPIAMDRAQIRHLEDVRELWARHDMISSLQEQFKGAMGWKKVGSAEYLTAYFTDPATGKKHMNSLGRRSPATELKKVEFDRARAEVDKALVELKRDLEPLIRVGKALRMGMLEPIAGDVLRELSRKELLGKDLMVIGSAGLHLYEAAAGALLPRSLIVEGDLDLMSSAESRQESIEALLPVLRVADKSFTLHGPSRSMRTDKGFRVHIHTRRSVGRAIDRLDGASDEQISVLREMIRLEPVKAVTIARDGTPVGMIGMDPRAFALTKHALATMEPDRDGPAARISKDQAYAVGRLVERFGSRQFDDYHLSAFPAFAESIETGDPEAQDAIGRFLRF